VVRVLNAGVYVEDYDTRCVIVCRTPACNVEGYDTRRVWYVC